MNNLLEALLANVPTFVLPNNREYTKKVRNLQYLHISNTYHEVVDGDGVIHTIRVGHTYHNKNKKLSKRAKHRISVELRMSQI